MTIAKKFGFGAVVAALAAAIGGMVIVATPASAATGGGCADPSVYGSYAIRACIGEIAGKANAYAYISLRADHSPCTLALRIGDDHGWVSAPITAVCPAGEVTHFDPFDAYAVSTHAGTWRAYVSITRDGDAIPTTKSTSPPMTV